MGVLERERVENDAEEIFKETMAEKFPKLKKISVFRFKKLR